MDRGFSGVFSLIDFAADICKFAIDLAKTIAEIAHEQEELFGLLQEVIFQVVLPDLHKDGAVLESNSSGRAGGALKQASVSDDFSNGKLRDQLFRRCAVFGINTDQSSESPCLKIT